MPPPARGNRGPKLIHQSPIQTVFIQLCLTSQLFRRADESANKKRWQHKKNRRSLHGALVLAFGGVGDCLGLPLGGINYTSFLKGPLWSSQECAERASSRGISHYSFLCSYIKLSLSSQTFLPEWKCGAFEMLLQNFNCPPPFLSFPL